MEPSKPATGTVDSSGNLRLPPFPPRKPNEMNPHDTPKARMNQDEANEIKNRIFQQLHEFEECVIWRYLILAHDNNPVIRRLLCNGYASFAYIPNNTTSSSANIFVQ